MMKILCLLVILANISLFMWEYRTGAFAERKEESPVRQDTMGREPIVLLDEVDSNKATLQPIISHQAPAAAIKSDIQKPTDKTKEDNEVVPRQLYLP